LIANFCGEGFRISADESDFVDVAEVFVRPLGSAWQERPRIVTHDPQGRPSVTDSGIEQKA
jgi:hypothetical protein